jgi:hypothetical protein
MLGAVLLALTSPFFHKSLGNLPFLVAFLTGGILVWTYLEAFSPFPLPQSEQKRPSGYFPTRKIVSLGVALWMAVQMIYPLWHYVIPGNASWTEEGHSFSWRMMLRSKQGKLAFFAHHPETQHRIPLEIDSLVTYWQLRDLNMEPYMMSQSSIHPLMYKSHCVEVCRPFRTWERDSPGCEGINPFAGVCRHLRGLGGLRHLMVGISPPTCLPLGWAESPPDRSGLILSSSHFLILHILPSSHPRPG